MNKKEATYNKLIDLIEHELKWSEDTAKHFAKVNNIDYKKHRSVLIVASRYGLDKIYRLTLEHRDLYHTTNYKENNKIVGVISSLSIGEYLLGKDILTKEQEKRVLEGISKYKDAFVDEPELLDHSLEKIK